MEGNTKMANSVEIHATNFAKDGTEVVVTKKLHFQNETLGHRLSHALSCATRVGTDTDCHMHCPVQNSLAQIGCHTHCPVQNPLAQTKAVPRTDLCNIR
jgi:hypothetical protein